MAYDRLKSVPPDRQGRRFTVVYIALTSLRAREIIRRIGQRDFLQQAGEENAWLQELALIVDEALKQEVQRRQPNR